MTLRSTSVGALLLKKPQSVFGDSRPIL